jgi:hypothetical protein
MNRKYDLKYNKSLQEKANLFAEAEIQRRGFLFRPHDSIEACRDYDDLFETLVAQYKQSIARSHQADTEISKRPVFGVPIQYLPYPD